MKYISKRIVIIIAFVLISTSVFWVMYHSAQLREKETEHANKHFKIMLAEISSIADYMKNAGNSFSEYAEREFQNTSISMEALLIYTTVHGVEYLRANDSGFVEIQDTKSTKVKARLNRNKELFLSDSFYTSRGTIFFVEAVYRAIDPDRFYALIRQTLILLLIASLGAVLCIVCYVLIIAPPARKRQFTQQEPALEPEISPSSSFEKDLQDTDVPVDTSSPPEIHSDTADGPDTNNVNVAAQSFEEVSASNSSGDSAIDNTTDDAATGDSAIDNTTDDAASETAAASNEDVAPTTGDEDSKEIEYTRSETRRIYFYQQKEELRKGISSELQRAVFYDQDLTLLAVSLHVQDQSIDPVEQIYSLAPIRELCYQLEEELFIIAIPQTQLNDAWKHAKKMFESLQGTVSEIELHIGISVQNKRLIDSSTLIRETIHALKKAKEDNRDILAFSPNPYQYRVHLRKQNDTQSTQENPNRYVFEELAAGSAPPVEEYGKDTAGNKNAFVPH